MKSKTFCFNRTIFWKNVTLYWPVWAGYLALLLIVIPCRIWLVFQNYGWQESAAYRKSIHLDQLANALDPQFMLVMVTAMALLTGMTLFHYLFVPRSAFMIHAFPVTRDELFGTNVITGLCFMLIPQFICFFISVLVCIGNGFTHVEYVGVYLLISMETSLLMFSMVCLCVMLAGQTVAVPVFMGLINFAVAAVRVMIQLLVSGLGFGLTYGDIDIVNHFDAFSPFYYLYRQIYITRIEERNGEIPLVTALRFEHVNVLLWYLIPTLLFFLGAYFLYKRRSMENAGDFVAVSLIRPVFRWGMGFGCCYLGGYLAGEIGGVYFDAFLPLIGAVCGLACGIAGYFLAQMLLEKGFRVFHRRTCAECGVLVGCLILSFAGLFGTSRYIEQWMPRESMIDTASLIIDYPLKMQGADIRKILSLHKEILSKAGQCRGMEYSKEWQMRNEEMLGMQILYEFTDGRKLSRYYVMPEEYLSGIDYFLKLEASPEMFLRELWGFDPDTTDVRMESACVYLWGEEEDFDRRILSGEHTEDDPNIAVARELYEAVIDDVKAGKLQKYNLSYYGGQNLPMMCNAVLDLSVVDRNAGPEERLDEIEDELYLTPSNIYFGEDCTNIIHVLEKHGIITSREDLDIGGW